MKVGSRARIIGAVSALLLLWLGSYCWRIVTARALSGKSIVITTSRGAIEYSELGRGSPVLVLHGMFGGYNQGAVISRSVSVPGNRFIAVSRPGYLRTPLSSGRSLEEQADLYAALLDSLKLEKVAVIAYSAGGHSAIPFVLKYPERCWALLLLSGHTGRMGVYKQTPSFKDRVAESVMTSDLTGLVFSSGGKLYPSLLQPTLGLNQAEVKALGLHPFRDLLVEFYESAFPIALGRDGFENDLREMANSTNYPLEHIRVPTLIIHGDDDPHLPFSEAERNASRIPTSTLLRIAHGGHYACLVHSDEIKAALENFLQRASALRLGHTQGGIP